jgi:V/A-type H+-transporting ATPase subunit E
MPLEEILKEIEEETNRQEEEILKEANSKAQQLLKDAEVKAQQIIENSKKKAKMDGDKLKRQIISAALLENRNKFEKEIESIQENILQNLNRKIQEFVNSPEYEKFLHDRIQKGWEKLGPGAIIYANQRDIEKINKFSFPLNVVQKEVDPLGGVIITSADGKMEIDYTLEEIIRNRMESLRKVMRDYILG